MADKDVKFVLSAQDRTAAAINGLRSNLGAVEGKVASLNSGFGGLAAVFGSAFAGLSLTAFIKGTASGIDKLNDLKDSTGSSIENLSALEDVAARTGSSFETVGQALVKFNKDLTAATPGSETANILKSLGLDAEKLKAIDPAEALRQTAVALGTFADDGDRARIITTLFGKSVKEVAPFLNDLAEKTKLVGTVTQEQAKEAEKFNQQLFAMQKNSTDFARALVSHLIPSLNNTFEAYKKFSVLDNLKAMFGLDAIGETTAAARVLRAEIKGTGDAVEKLTAKLKADPGNTALKDQLEGARTRLQQLLQDAGAAAEKLKVASTDVLGVTSDEPKKKRLGGGPDKVKDTRAEKIDDARTALAAYVNGLQREEDKLRDISDEQKALNFLKSIGTVGEIPQVRELVLGLAAQNDELSDQAVQRKLNNDLARDAERQAQALADFTGAGNSVAEGVRQETAALGLNAGELKRQTELRRLEEIVKHASINATETQKAKIQELAAAMRVDLVGALGEAQTAQTALNSSFSDGAKKALDTYVAAAADRSAQAEQLITNSTRGAEDALVQLATTGKGSFKSLIDSMIADLARLEARKGLASLIGFFGGDSGSGGADTSPSFDTGSLTNPTGKRASGINVNITNTHSGASVSASRDNNGDLQVLVEQVAERVHNRVAADVGSGTGRVAGAMKARGLNLGNAAIRRT